MLLLAFKGPFRDPQPRPPIFHKRSGDFNICIFVDAFWYICMYAKCFFQIHLFEEIIAALAIYYVDMKMKNIQHCGLCNRCKTIKCA